MEIGIRSRVWHGGKVWVSTISGLFPVARTLAPLGVVGTLLATFPRHDGWFSKDPPSNFIMVVEYYTKL